MSQWLQEEPQLTVPQIIEKLREVHSTMASDPCLEDLAPGTAHLIDEVLERCRLAADVAAEIKREHEFH
ncbi:MAG: hypothetical protein ACR2PO_19785 [Methyloligellaceae bacterium]